ncbi:MAG: ATP-binding protein [Pseudomonadota bacterium]
MTAPPRSGILRLGSARGGNTKHSPLRQFNTRQRAGYLRLVVVILLVVIAIGGSLAVARGMAQLLWFLIPPVLACALVPFVFRRGDRNSFVAEHFLTTGALLCVLGIGIATGGGHLSVLIWAIFLPALAVIMTGWRSGVIYLVVSFCALTLIYLQHRLGWPVWVEVTPEYALDDVLTKAPLALIAVTLLAGGIRSRLHAGQKALARRERFDLMGQLTGSVAHDFNNLLGVMVGNLELLDDATQDNAEARKLIADMRSAAMSGGELVRGLQSLSDKRFLSPRPLPVSAHIRQNLPLIQRAVAKNGVTVRLRDFSDGAVAKVDPAQLDSAVLNLCINARDAMPDGGSIEIAVLSKPTMLQIEVVDTGVGMSDAIVRKAVDPFFSTKEKGKGTGLGLSMVKAFADNSGGEMSIQSTLGQGSRIRLELPRVPGAQASSELLDSEPAPRGQEHVLAVDDEAELRKLCAQMLQSLGYRVSTAANALEARKLLAGDSSISAVLTDWVMPGQSDGYQLAEWVQANRPDVTVLMTSGYSPGAPQRPGLPLLPKPFTRAQLARCLREALDGRWDSSGVATP